MNKTKINDMTNKAVCSWNLALVFLVSLKLHIRRNIYTVSLNDTVEMKYIATFSNDNRQDNSKY